MIHSNIHNSFYHRLEFLVTLTVLLKKFTPQPDLTPIINALLSLSIIHLILILYLLLISFWHPVSNWLLTDNLAWRNKIRNAQN
jgi:ABC-type tungstate transport system substrate-binding protein